MSSYQVNADLLFESDSSSASADDDLPTAIHAPSPKRTRPSSTTTTTAASRRPTFPPPSSTPSALPSAPFSFPSFTASASFRPSHPASSSASAASSFPSFSTRSRNNAPPAALANRPYGPAHAGRGRARGHQPPRRPPEPRSYASRADEPSRAYGAVLGPMGRGRGATLPAHVTANRPGGQHVTVGRPAPAVEHGLAEEDALNEAAAILPEHLRERYLKEARKHSEEVASVVAERRRQKPGRRRKEGERHSQMVDGKKRAGMGGGGMGKKRKPEFQLSSLLAAAGKQDAGLISLDPDRVRGGVKVRKTDAANVYKAVSRTKESVEREQRLAREEQVRREEEARMLREFYEDLREREREERKCMAHKWRLQKTVASEMRDSHFVARVEKHLFGGEDKAKADNLDYLGLHLRPLEEDEQVKKLLTVEVIHI